MSFEKSMNRLDEIIASLDNDKLPLDDALELYKEGIALSAECKKSLENAKQQVKVLDNSEASGEE